MDEENIKIRRESQLVVSQIIREAQAKDPLLQRYLKLAREKLAKFKTFEVAHVPHEVYILAYVFFRLTSIISLRVNHYLIQENMKVLSIETLGYIVIDINNVLQPSWMSPIIGALLALGFEHSRLVCTNFSPFQISYCSGGILHQIGRSESIGEYHDEKYLEVLQMKSPG